MAFVPAPNVAQVELLYTWAGQEVANVLHYQAPDPMSIPDMNTVGQFFVDWFDNTMQPLVPNTVDFRQVKITDLTTQFSPVVEYTNGLPLTGTLVGSSMPNNVSVVITKRTALRGRSFRGRIYHIGLTEGQVTENTVNAQPMADILAAWTAVLDVAVDVESWPMVVLSRYEEGAERTQALATNVVNLSTDGGIDSQRRRLPGRGQ